jgi:hypothetical protein
VTSAEKRKLVRRLQAGKRRAKRERPQRLKEVERQMDLIEEQRRAASDPQERASLIREIAALGRERRRFQS